MIDITVKVPEERVPDFYTMFGRWLAGGYPGTGESEPDSPTIEMSKWSHGDEELAKQLWDKFNDRAKALFATLLKTPGRQFTGQELADLLEIPNGPSGVAGVLAWPGRYCRQYRRTICWNVSSRQDDDYLAVYWMEGVLADLFRKASGV